MAQCNQCGILAFDQREKMTDVNIATHMFIDAMKDSMDDAILVTGDSDQRPTVDVLRKVFGKRVVVCFPPKRYSKNLEDGASESFFAPEEYYRKSQFPQIVDVAGVTRWSSLIGGSGNSGQL